MSFYFLDPRSDNDYGESENDGVEYSFGWSDIFWLPVAFVFACFIGVIPFLALTAYFLYDVYTTTRRTVQTGELSYPFLVSVGAIAALVLLTNVLLPVNKPVQLSLGLVAAIGFIVIFTLLPCLALALHALLKFRAFMMTKSGGMRSYGRYLVLLGVLLGAGVLLIAFLRPSPIPAVPVKTPTPVKQLPPLRTTVTPLPNSQTPAGRSISILVDDFSPQPYQGQPIYFFNRLESDRGAINNSLLDWGRGEVTTTIASGNSWGGVWMNLNHPIRESLSINFSAILPEQILLAYQSQITGLLVRIARGTPHVTFRLELKNHGNLRWKHEIELSGSDQTIGVELPPLSNINELVWVLDHAAAGDYVVLDSVSFTATTSITDTAMTAFVWSYGQLLTNWNPATGLVRDKAKDASGEFDAIQATGSLAAATASAEQLGIVDHATAVEIVQRIERTLLSLPRWHGLWPHWVKASATGNNMIVPGTEWSSVDTIIAALGLLDAQSGLGLDTSDTEQFLQAIDWADLVVPGGISHGYTYAGDRLPYAWDVFGGESWLVELVYAGVTGQVEPLAYPTPPTANGSGFIDELAWLYVLPPDQSDYWGTDWAAYRRSAAEDQIAYYALRHPIGCAGELGLFGLSASEVPVPSSVQPASIYQAFGVGGRFAAANDGADHSSAGVIVPHYAALAASLYPQEAIRLWDWLMMQGYFTPLTNVESVSFDPTCDAAQLKWNSLKGSWNLALQTLGWGRYLAERNGQTPIAWQATTANALLQRGYHVLVPDRTSPSSPLPTPSTTVTTWMVLRECENPDEATIGQMIWRSNASGSQVHGQFGAAAESPWPTKSGYVKYKAIDIPTLDQMYLKLRYSKHSSASVPILIYLDDEPDPRAVLNPIDQGDWNNFAWTAPIPLGKIDGGLHSLKFSTDGQQ
jgi:hypothetical protein